MKQVNYRSDFDFLLTVPCADGADAGFPAFDWTLELWAGTARGRSVTVSCIGGECTGCFNDGGRIHIVLKDHGLAPGPLRGVFIANLDDAIYPDGIRREVTPDHLGIELTTGKGDAGTLESTLVLPVLRVKEKKRRPIIGPRILSRRALTMNSHPEYAYKVARFANHGEEGCAAVRFDFRTLFDEDYTVDSDTLTHLVSRLKTLRRPSGENTIEMFFFRGSRVPCSLDTAIVDGAVTYPNYEFPDYDPATNTLTVRRRTDRDPSVRMYIFAGDAIRESDYAYLREDGSIGLTNDVIIPRSGVWPTRITGLEWNNPGENVRPGSYNILTDKGMYQWPAGTSRRRNATFGQPRKWLFDVQWFHTSIIRSSLGQGGRPARRRWIPCPKQNGGVVRVRIAAHDGQTAGPWQYFRHQSAGYSYGGFVRLG